MCTRALAGIGLAAALAWGGVAGCGGAPQSEGDAGQGTEDAGPDADDLDAGPPDAGDGGDTDAGAPSPFSDEVGIIVEPGDNAAALITAIDGAKKSVHMTMYLLTTNQIIAALEARHQAGVDVKVVLNKTFPTTGNSNATVFSQLAAAGVSVVWAPAQFTYTHEKCVILDGTTAWIMTMNATTSAPTSNREYLAVDTDPEDVQEAEAVFEGDFTGHPLAKVTGKLLVSPLNVRTRLLQLIGSAKKTIDLEGEELSDTLVVNALVAAQAAGIKVRVVVASGTLTSAQQAAAAKLKQKGVAGVETSTPYIHAKAIVVDGAGASPTAYVGSANFTSVSLDQNRELGLVTSKASEIAKVSAAIAADFAAGKAF